MALSLPAKKILVVNDDPLILKALAGRFKFNAFAGVSVYSWLRTRDNQSLNPGRELLLQLCRARIAS